MILHRLRTFPTYILAATLALTVIAAADAGAQTRRALVIGINRYETAASAPAAGPGHRGKITDLGGAVNDAMAMRDLLQSRFAFPAANVTLMSDQQATRAGILAAIEQLGAQSARGDVVVFFYAGHGSQRRNSLSPEMSKLDQTIVPADANAGAFDIRDKELARAFNALLDKGVELVLIFDSCHSGSVARGGIQGESSGRRERWAAIDERDAADPGVETPPEARSNGALVISAAQDYQLATEKQDANGEQHGIFTSAMIAALQSVPPNEPVADVFKRVKARMQMDGHLQEPVLAGPPDRLRRPIFGGAAGTRGRTSVAVLRISPQGQVTLQGGPALGIRKGAELRKTGSTAADTSVRLRVDSVLSVSQVRASVTAGARDRIAVGDLFELERWVAAENGGVLVAFASGAPAAAALQATAAEVAKLRGTAGIEWLDDPTTVPADTTPTYVMQWSGTGWELRSHIGAPIPLPLTPTAAQVRAALQQREPARPVRFFLSLPPTADMATAFRTAIGEGSAVRLTTDVAAANYVLVGRVSGGALQYALIQPTASLATANQSSLPLRTEWLAATNTSGAANAGPLVDHAFTLAKVRSWLQLEAPPNDGAFPYRLAFRRLSDGAIRKEGPFTQGETYEIVLVADPAHVTAMVERRRIYIFGIDNKGRSQLLYPQSQVENRVPFALGADSKWPSEIPLGQASRFTVEPPFGVDTFILLTSDETIEPWAFQWSGVRGAEDRGPGSSLSKLLSGASGATRGFGNETPLKWSIDRVMILSQPAR